MTTGNVLADAVGLTCLALFVAGCIWMFCRHHPEKPVVLKAGVKKEPPSMYGKCSDCGCIFSVRKVDARLSSAHGNVFVHDCPTEEGCGSVVGLTNHCPEIPKLLPPKGGSGVSRPKEGT